MAFQLISVRTVLNHCLANLVAPFEIHCPGGGLLLLLLRLLPLVWEFFGLALLCAETALMGWLVLKAKYGKALELCTIPCLGKGGGAH